MSESVHLNRRLLVCPLCSRTERAAGSSWGSVVMNAAVEKSIIESNITKATSLGELADGINSALSLASKTTLWCTCGRAVWMQGYGWLITLDFIVNVAKAIRQRLPGAYESVLRELREFMPGEFQRVVEVVGGGVDKP